MNSLPVNVPPIRLVQQQLDTTLQLLVSLSPLMTINDIILVRIRLTEASILMGSILVERENSPGNDGSPALALPLLSTYSSR